MSFRCRRNNEGPRSDPLWMPPHVAQTALVHWRNSSNIPNTYNLCKDNRWLAWSKASLKSSSHASRTTPPSNLAVTSPKMLRCFETTSTMPSSLSLVKGHRRQTASSHLVDESHNGNNRSQPRLRAVEYVIASLPKLYLSSPFSRTWIQVVVQPLLKGYLLCIVINSFITHPETNESRPNRQPRPGFCRFFFCSRIREAASYR